MGDDVGDGAVDADNAWSAAAPHGEEDDRGVPVSVEGALDGDVSFDGIEEGLEVPEDSDRGSLGAGDGLGDRVTFEGRSIEVASFDRGVTFVGGGEVVSVKGGVEDTAEDPERGGEDPNGLLFAGVFFGNGGERGEKGLERGGRGW